MSESFLEHANITVANPARSAAMLEQIFGWKTRWTGAAKDGGVSYHVGGADSYVALYSRGGTQRIANTSATIGALNHLGVVVDDLDAVEARVKAFGLTPINHADYEPGRRFYFLDHDGTEIEVVSYS